MATAIQRRRGNTAQHASFTGLAGEITIDTDKNTVVVHDGSTAGGFPLATQAEVNALGGADITAVVAGAGLTGGATSGDATINVVGGAGITVSADNVAVNATYVKNLFSATDSGGDGSFSYSDGVFTYTGPSATEVRAHLTGGAGLTFTSGTFAVGAGTGITVNADDVAVNAAYVKGLFSATDSGGDGSFSYSDGVFTYTGPSQAEANARIDARLSGTAGITYSSGAISVNQGYFDKTAGGTGLAANFEPAANNTYSLGSLNNVWKDIYVGPGSLYVNGQKVLADNSGTITVSSDAGQNLALVTSAGGDIELSAGATGDIQLKSNVILSAGKTITASGGLKLSSNLDVNSQYINNVTNPVQAQDAATKSYVDDATYLSAGDGISKSTGQFSVDNTVVRTTGTQTIGGAKTFSADLVVSGNLTVSGTTTTVNSETISLADNIIDLNSNFTTGSPSENAGIRIKRGDSSDVQLRWNEADDKWQFTNDGSAYLDMLTATQVKALFSATDAGGDGSFSYSDGVFTYTGPSQNEANTRIDARLSGTDGISYSSGVISLASSTAGAGLTYSSGVLAVVGGSGITVNADNVALSASGVTAGTYGSATAVGQVVVDTYGRVTTASNITVTPAVGSITGLASGMASFLAAGNASTFAGAVSGTSGSGDIVLSTSPVLVTPNLGTPSSLVLTNATGLKIEGIAAGNILTSAETFVDTDNQLMTAAAIDDRILSYGYTTNVGDITGVTAGNGLTGGGLSGDVTLNIGGGYGISVNADNIELANTDVRGLFSGTTGISYNSGTGAFSLDTSTGGAGLTYSSGVLAVGAGAGITVNADNVALSTSGVTSGTYGSASAVGQVVVDTYGRVTSASNVTISVTSTQVSDFSAAVRGNISVTDAGGDGSLGYNSSTGVITYTGPSQAEANTRIDARLSAGTGISYSSGVIALSHLGIQSLIDPNADRILFWDDSAGAAAWLEVSTGLSVSGTTLTNSGVTSITGTANQVTASASTGGVTLSLPQSIHTGASPTFAGATLSSITKGGTDGTGDIGQSANKFGTVYATTFSGTATTAKYADLAERYEADDVLEPGTVVCFGGSKEITACDHPNDHAVAGVISTDPAYMMNSDAGTDATHPYVALTGRVPVKVTGEVNKGDLLVASGIKGHAMANNNAKAGTIIGKAIGSSAGGEAVIEVLIHLM